MFEFEISYSGRLVSHWVGFPTNFESSQSDIKRERYNQNANNCSTKTIITMRPHSYNLCDRIEDFKEFLGKIYCSMRLHST